MSAKEKRILFVSDGSALAKELVEVFEDLNYSVLETKTAKEAAQKVTDGDPDIVVASMDGPAKGADLCKTLKEGKAKSPVPVVLMSSESNAEDLFRKHQKERTNAEAYVRLPVPPEDVVDWVERLVGLPSPPNGSKPSSARVESPSVGLDTDAAQLRKEKEELQEQIHFYEQQLAQVSVAGEKESREMDQVLKELQEDLDHQQKDKEKLREEIQLLKGEISQKEKELREKEKALGDAREEMQREKAEVERQLEEVRATFSDKEDKHKRAQNALREYYKPKIAKMTKLERTVSALEDELVKLSAEVKNRRDEVAELQKEGEKAKEALEAEKEKREKIREALEQTRKMME